jgi:hypothetical protein
MIALGCDATSDRLSPASFLTRAQELLQGAAVSLKWHTGDPTERNLDRADDWISAEYPRARYLSQQFVEELCSAHGMTRGSNAFGVPSTGLSLGWLLASRASLRFTRQSGDSGELSWEQEQSRGASQADLHGRGEHPYANHARSTERATHAEGRSLTCPAGWQPAPRGVRRASPLKLACVLGEFWLARWFAFDVQLICVWFAQWFA